MRTDPVVIEGVAGPVVAATSGRRGALVIEVAGEPAEQLGEDHWMLPGRGGKKVSAQLKARFWHVYPTLVVGDSQVRLGPVMPVWLRVLALLPAVLLVIGPGLSSVVVALLGVLLNHKAMQDGRTHRQRGIRVAVQDVLVFAFFFALLGNTIQNIFRGA